MDNFKLRDYQEVISSSGKEILERYKILILNLEVRTGKTHIALDIAKTYNNVLFVTKKKAISSIEGDYSDAGHTFKITVINYESLHKVRDNYDLVICDESHCLSAYPKPSKRTKEIKLNYSSSDFIFLTGTLLPESNSQIFHQLWISKNSPFNNYKNFYQWHKEFGTPKVQYTSYGVSNDYSEVEYSKIKRYINQLSITYTQEKAGFETTIKETVLLVPMKSMTHKIINKLKKDLVVEGSDEVILADTAVKLMQKVHQLSSGTVKFESGNSSVIDDSKAVYIKEKFKGKKLAIFYKFKAELVAIKTMLDVTQDIEEFNTTDKHIALQFVSGREGINLSAADYIVAYNIDFSAVTYFQFKDRMTTKERQHNEIFWLFSDCGIEKQIYKSVMGKKNYTLQTFKQDA